MDPIRYGLIGTGMMGIEHALNLLHLDDIEITCIADPEPNSRDLLKLFVKDRFDPTQFSDHRQLIASGLCDAVVIASPNMTHRQILLDCLEADLHILVEKPLCISVPECKQVQSAAQNHDKIVWVGLEYRFMPPIARLITEAHQNQVGEIKMISIREHRFPFLQKVNHWNRFNRNSGGTLVEKCCHFFDLMNHLSRAKPISVFASGAQDVNHLDEIYEGETPDILDNALVIVEYDNGTRASLDLNMFAEGSLNQEEICVVGSTGKLEAFLPSCEFRKGMRQTGRQGVVVETVHDPRVLYEGFHHGSSYLEHLAFKEAIETGTTPEVGLAEGTLAVALGVAAQTSIAQRRVVEVEEVLADE